MMPISSLLLTGLFFMKRIGHRGQAYSFSMNFSSEISYLFVNDVEPVVEDFLDDRLYLLPSSLSVAAAWSWKDDGLPLIV
jgi:hypothetical protein